MGTYTGVRIVSAARLNNSASGNPRWHVTFDREPFAAETAPDSQCGFIVENYAGRGNQPALTVETNGFGHVTAIKEEKP